MTRRWPSTSPSIDPDRHPWSGDVMVNTRPSLFLIRLEAALRKVWRFKVVNILSYLSSTLAPRDFIEVAVGGEWKCYREVQSFWWSLVQGLLHHLFSVQDGWWFPRIPGWALSIPLLRYAFLSDLNSLNCSTLTWNGRVELVFDFSRSSNLQLLETCKMPVISDVNGLGRTNMTQFVGMVLVGVFPTPSLRFHEPHFINW